MSDDDAIVAAAALADPVRRQLFELVTRATEPVGKDDAAAAARISRSLAGYHLDQLVDAGLLTVSYSRRSGRTGPGAGRPAQLNAPAAVEVSVQLPPRDDALLAHLLATAVATDTSGEARRSLGKVTRAAGRALGRDLPPADVPALLQALEARGYAPIEAEDGIRLRNCPFHHLVADHLELVCGLNKDLLSAAAAAANVGLKAVLDPQPGRCCVVLRRP
jgi:predicted ArsR family transcriptional regulator